MKKNLLLILSVIFTTVGFAQGNVKANHWSASIETGLNLFDGDMTVYYSSLLPEANFQLSYGGSLEYTFNPYVGLGLEYYHLPLTAKKNNDSFTSKLNHYNAYLAINLLNIFNRKVNTPWAIYGTIGAGIATYASTYYVSNVAQTVNPETKMALTIPVGAMIEHNISNSIALGVKFQYRSHNKDNLEGNSAYDYKGVTNDFVTLTTLSLRWKFNSYKKQHVRNMNPDKFYYNDALAPALQAKIKTDSLQNEVNRLRKELDDVKPQLKEIEKTLLELKKQDNKANNTEALQGLNAQEIKKKK